MKLTDGKAPGNDGIYLNFLKSLSRENSEPLSRIFNKMILTALSYMSGRELILHHCSNKDHGLNQENTDQRVWRDLGANFCTPF